ncbi:hypothetical protein AB4527_01540 [Vibrio breoganii]
MKQILSTLFALLIVLPAMASSPNNWKVSQDFLQMDQNSDENDDVELSVIMRTQEDCKPVVIIRTGRVLGSLIHLNGQAINIDTGTGYSAGRAESQAGNDFILSQLFRSKSVTLVNGKIDTYIFDAQGFTSQYRKLEKFCASEKSIEQTAL